MAVLHRIQQITLCHHPYRSGPARQLGYVVIINWLLSLLIYSVFAIIMFVSLFTSPPGVSSFRKGAWQIIIMVFFAAVTMCLNLCCTSKSSFYLDCNSVTQTCNQVAIVVKLWRTHQLVSSNYGRSLFPVIAVIIESGALYTAGVASLLISLLARSSGQAIPRDMLPPLVVSAPR
jgi:hypothetical protein